MGEAAAQPGGRPAPRVPAHAWSWLQRSRLVLHEAARRLTGAPPTPSFVEELRARYAEDAFTRAVLADVIVEVAFCGRVPQRRPPGVSWDRGLTWWAALLSGTSPDAYDAPAPAVTQRSLFDDAPAQQEAPVRPLVGAGGERSALAVALRQLVESAEGDAVPVAALRQLIAALEKG